MLKHFLKLSCLLFFCSCAFTPHIDKRTYQTSTVKNEVSNKQSISIMVSGDDSNIVGYIRNGFGTETANIEVPQTKKNLIQTALEQEFTAMGFTIDSNSPLRLLARVKQVEVELAQEEGKAGYYAICDLQAYLKQDSKILERNFVENDKIDSFWAVTATEGITTFYKAINKCSNLIVSEVSKRLKK